MKGLFVFLILSVVAPNAFAERWILKNPSSPLLAAKAIHRFELGGDLYVVVNLPRFSEGERTIRAMAESAVPDLRITLPRTESWGTPTEAWHVKKMRYGELPSERDGKGVIVAVLDTGVDYTHTALKDKIWVNEKEIPGNQIDDDQNGFVDDIHGFDFESDDADPKDGDAHGTHCAGIIAAGLDDKSGAIGVAPGAKIMAVRIIGWEQMGFLSDAVAGIKYAVDNGAQVLSNSWRVYQSWRSFDPSDKNIELLRLAIEYASNKGAIFVAAAGNEQNDLDREGSDPMYPGGFLGLPNLVVVAASDAEGNPASFTNFGLNRVTVAAPGDEIVSTVPGNQWYSMSGTSMAAPLVAGALARGISSSFASNLVVDKLVKTSKAADSWKQKTKSGGVIELVDYLAP